MASDTNQEQQSVMKKQSEEQPPETWISSQKDLSSLWIPVEQDQKPFQCGLCSMTFAVNIDLVSHVHNHSFTKPYQCGYCKMSYSNNPQLIVHVKLHTVFMVHVPPSSTAVGVSQPVQTLLPADSNPSGLLFARKSQGDEIANENENLLFLAKSDVTECSKPDAEGSDDDKAIKKPDLTTISSAPSVISNVETTTFTSVESKIVHETLWNCEKKIKSEQVDDDDIVKSEKYTGILQAEAECSKETLVEGSKFSESDYVDKRTFRCKDNHQKPFHCDICGVTFKAARYVKDHKRRSHKMSFAATESCHKQSNPKYEAGTRSESVSESGRSETKVLQEPDTNTANRTVNEISDENTVVMDSTIITNRKSNVQKCFTCSECGKITRNRHSLRQHKRIVHSNTRSFPCSLCPKRLKTKSSLNDHMSFIHSDERPFPCSYCSRRFKKKFGLVAHVARVHENQRPFSCSHCEACFGSRGELTSHVNRKHNTEAPHQCTDCGKCFKVKDSLRKHFCKPKECQLCSCVLNCSKSYNYHMQQHNYSSPREYFHCSKCVFKGVVTKEEVDVHIKSHEYQRPYICEFCGQSFTRKIYLYYHQNSAHFNNRPYKCDICQKEFTSHPNLAQHKRRHFSYKKYACDQCDKKFYTYSNLQRHTLTHTDLRMHACSVCGKTYRSHSNLSYHVKHSHPP